MAPPKMKETPRLGRRREQQRCCFAPCPGPTGSSPRRSSTRSTSSCRARLRALLLPRAPGGPRRSSRARCLEGRPRGGGCRRGCGASSGRTCEASGSEAGGRRAAAEASRTTEEEEKERAPGCRSTRHASRFSAGTCARRGSCCPTSSRTRWQGPHCCRSAVAAKRSERSRRERGRHRGTRRRCRRGMCSAPPRP